MLELEQALAKFSLRLYLAAVDIEHSELTESREPLHSSDWIVREAVTAVLKEDIADIKVSAFARELEAL